MSQNGAPCSRQHVEVGPQEWVWRGWCGPTLQPGGAVLACLHVRKPLGGCGADMLLWCPGLQLVMAAVWVGVGVWTWPEVGCSSGSAAAWQGSLAQGPPSCLVLTSWQHVHITTAAISRALHRGTCPYTGAERAKPSCEHATSYAVGGGVWCRCGGAAHGVILPCAAFPQ